MMQFYKNWRLWVTFYCKIFGQVHDISDAEYTDEIVEIIRFRNNIDNKLTEEVK